MGCRFFVFLPSDCILCYSRCIQGVFILECIGVISSSKMIFLNYIGVCCRFDYVNCHLAIFFVRWFQWVRGVLDFVGRVDLVDGDIIERRWTLSLFTKFLTIFNSLT